MKKFTVLLLALITLVTVLAGCGKEEEPLTPLNASVFAGGDPEEVPFATLYAKDFEFSEGGYKVLIPGAAEAATYSFTSENSDGIVWKVYVFDEEFPDGLRYITHAAEPVLVGDGDVPVTAGQFVYVHCSAHGTTTVCTDENVKLIITVK